MADTGLPQEPSLPLPGVLPPTEDLPVPEGSPVPELSPLPEIPSASLPVEGGTQAGTTVQGGEALPPRDNGLGLPVWGWAGIGLAVGLILGAVIAVLLCRRKRAAAPVPAPAPAPAPFPATAQIPAQDERAAPAPPLGGTVLLSPIRVEKIHEQGARSSQQDCFFVSPEDMFAAHGQLAVVADGMGGLADGDKVSQAAVTAMMSGFYAASGAPEQVLLVLLQQAVQAVDSLLGPDGFQRSGSTLVAGLVRNGEFHYLSVGDSRICLYRDGVLYQLNREHIFRNELCIRAVNGTMSFQEAAEHPKGGGLTSFLGMGPLKYVDLPAQPVAIRPGDCFLLMSDGVYNALPGGELENLLRENEGHMADALRGAIQAKGYSNQDNYTAIILHC